MAGKGQHTDTLLAQALGWLEETTGGVTPAIQPATTYVRDPAMPASEGLWYSRPDNPCYWQVEALLAELEHAEAAMVTGSGSASMAMVFEALHTGNHVLMPHYGYGGIHYLIGDMINAWGIEIDTYTTGDLDDMAAKLRPGVTKIVWVETPSNAELVIVDVERVAELAHEAGARVVVDATFAPPPIQRVLDQGADIVLHSATKFLNGHSDVVCGTIATRVKDDYWHRLDRMRMRSGAMLGPFEAWLLLRGLRTLHLRMEQAQRNAQKVAAFLDSHTGVTKVYYPGLPSHPTHTMAKRLMTGFGAMVSFEVDGDEAYALRVWGATKLIKNATSLGGPETLIEHRRSSDAYDSPVPVNQLRLSIGLEDGDDLIADLDAALAGRTSNRPMADATKMAQGLGWTSSDHKAVVLPLHLASTYATDPASYGKPYAYARDQNPTYEQPEALIAELEEGEQARLFGSGMAAASAVFQALKAGDHVVMQETLYWALRGLMASVVEGWGIEVTWFPTGDLDALQEAVRPGETRIVWLETPANPTMTVTDIAAATAIAREAGAVSVVDNTFATPLHCRPLTLGADIVMHSATKYLNGHSDIVAGVLIARETTPFWEHVCHIRHMTGAILGPFEAWLLMRGLRTLGLRVGRASENAMAIALHLEGHDGVAEVLYPGLSSFRGHNIAGSQMSGGFGGMLSIRIKGGEAGARKAWARFKLFKIASSLGGVESLVEHRATVEGPESPVPDDLLRLSVGVEHVDDLIADLEQALQKLG
ncbi:MAG: aminotransferase class V-fold PLP-dependent enzyme [Alphaproteobacteria bacterium]|jgi:cystathionine gamma-synthase|nr:aminotransferase class V-fold PLP-dependent enzyme [Rhodospirillaceae bacterium]MBT7612328.1 aminotransferase class V-fold PLP-dependent enzyme [Rhodospirillaceae bacterium]MBT7648961.1 aminotransferase class V-fold PLP-dependent enzyme [Rhodospirillaceae bacterium]MDG2482448.1 aminotransferase class V-fold PLP-dependent enzyme [Alphaproteobacteria bacterium]